MKAGFGVSSCIETWNKFAWVNFLSKEAKFDWQQIQPKSYFFLAWRLKYDCKLNYSVTSGSSWTWKKNIILLVFSRMLSWRRTRIKNILYQNLTNRACFLMNLQLKRKVNDARNVMWFDFSWKTQISLFHGATFNIYFREHDRRERDPWTFLLEPLLRLSLPSEL